MRSETEMMALVLDLAKQDDRIRAVYLSGSRVDPDATLDRYSDFDIVWLVRDIRLFTSKDDWLECFGDRLIMQKPADWHGHPYDYASRNSFNYLMQFKDGNRIDLSLIDLEYYDEVLADLEPRQILLDKDTLPGLQDIAVNGYYNMNKPGEQEFADCCNEFWWLAVNVGKGSCRDELFFAWSLLEHYEMDMFLKLLNWSIAMDRDYTVSTGKFSKYLKRYLPETDMKRLAELFPHGDYADMWQKLFDLCGFFHELAIRVSTKLGYPYDIKEADQVKAYVTAMKNDAVVWPIIR